MSGALTGAPGPRGVLQAVPFTPSGSPFGAHISAAGHRERFDQAWQASGGVVTFLGDWHAFLEGWPPTR